MAEIVKWVRAHGPFVLTIVGAVAAWEGLTRLFEVPKWMLPPLSSVVAALIRRIPTMGPDIATSLFEMVCGFTLAVFIGLALALALVTWRPMERLLYPWLIATQVVPKIAVAPLLVVWFGFGLMPKVLIAFVVAFFPMVINSVIGLRSVRPEMIHLARSMGLSGLRLFWKITCPNALPYMFGGIKLAAAFSVSGAITGEFVGADRGLGYLLIVTNGQLDTALNLGVILLLVAIGIMFFTIVELVERLAIPWHVAARKRAEQSGRLTQSAM